MHSHSSPIPNDKPANPAFTFSEINEQETASCDAAAGSISDIVVPPLRLIAFAVLCCPAGGADRDRTDDLKLAKLALSQLSYGP